MSAPYHLNIKVTVQHGTIAYLYHAAARINLAAIFPQYLHGVRRLSHSEKFKRGGILETCLVRVIDTRLLKIMRLYNAVLLQLQIKMHLFLYAVVIL